VPEVADHRFALKLLAWIVGIWLTALALLFEAASLPPEASGTVIVLFPPRMNAAESVSATAAAGAKLVSASWFENVLVVADEAPGLSGRLHEVGALEVFRNMSFAGCVGANLPRN